MRNLDRPERSLPQYFKQLSPGTLLSGRLWAFLLILLTLPASAQVTVEFFDDFESGLGNWTVTGGYGLSTTYAYSGSNSLTESPVGNYPDASIITATLTTGIDLSSALDADLNFWAIYDIEEGVDYLYVEASGDGGGSWVTLGSFDGENNLSPWIQYNYSLGGFAGSSDVRVRFQFISDGFVNYDGMYIDDVEITSSNTDFSAPLLLYTPPELYEGSASDFVVDCELVDPSGISMATLNYQVDGGAVSSVTGTSGIDDEYAFIVPEQTPGSWVDFWIQATDAAPLLNTMVSDTFSYIAGNYLGYDDGTVSFVNSFGTGPGALSGTGAAVRISMPVGADLVTALIRNYTDPGRPNDDFIFHVWDDAGGSPGVDLITPFSVTPEATLSNPNPMTRVDLRPYAADLAGLTGDIWIGMEVPTGEVWVTQTTPGLAGRTATFNFGTWTGISDDFHFRVITSPPLGAPEADFSWDNSMDPTIAYTDLSTNTPTAWDWDFGDGGTSTLQNPDHTYAVDGDYTVCLTATNAASSDTECKTVPVSGNNPDPIADFSWALTDPSVAQIDFTDLSVNAVSWLWDFGDGNSSVDQNPTHFYTAAGTYSACLTASNSVGETSDTCKDVTAEIVSSLTDLSPESVILAPNPADQILNVDLGQALQESGSWAVYSLEGRLVKSGKLASGARMIRLETSDMQTGHYLLQLENGAGLWNHNFQVSH
jgi:PKD repeat protein